MRRGTSPDIALQGIELDELSGRVALCRWLSVTDGSRNGSLRSTAGDVVTAWFCQWCRS
jgi:hypothetical protein